MKITERSLLNKVTISNNKKLIIYSRFLKSYQKKFKIFLKMSILTLLLMTIYIFENPITMNFILLIKLEK